MEEHTCTREVGESSVNTLVEELLKNVEDEETKLVEEVGLGVNRPMNKIIVAAERPIYTKENPEKGFNVQSVVDESENVSPDVGLSVLEPKNNRDHITVENIVEDLLIEAIDIVNDSSDFTETSKENITHRIKRKEMREELALENHIKAVENTVNDLLIEATNIVNESNHLTDISLNKENRWTESQEEPSSEKRDGCAPNRDVRTKINLIGKLTSENDRLVPNAEVELVPEENETEHKSNIDSKLNGNKHDHQQNHETQSPEIDSDEMEQDVLRNDLKQCENSMDISDSAHQGENDKESKKSSKAKKTDRKSKDKNEKNAIHSETQRIIRESTVSLPYHHPRQMSLKDFLNRKKSSHNLGGDTSTPKEKICVRNMRERYSEEISTSESANHSPLEEADKPKTDSANEKFTTPLQELKHNLMAIRKSISLPKISTEPLYSPVCLDIGTPDGVEQLINRFIKHTSKPSTPATPETCSLNIVSKDIDASGKEILKQEQIKVNVTPSSLHNISSGPKINELKSKLRSEISLKKMREREKRLLAYKLDNEEVNDEEDILSDDDASLEDGLKNRDSNESASDNEMDVSDDEDEEEEEEEEEGSLDDDSDDEDDIIHTSKARNKRFLFLDDEAEESGEDGGCDDHLEETDNEVNENVPIKKKFDSDEVNEKMPIKENFNDEAMKNEKHDNNTSGNNGIQGGDTSAPRRDADSSFEIMGSLIPAAQPGGGLKFGGNPSTADSDSEEERSDWLDASLQEISQKDHESQDNLEQKSVFNPTWNKGDDGDTDANDLLLQFCSGRFTQKTPMLENNKENIQLTTKGDDSSNDDDNSFLIGRKRIANKPELVLRKNIDSEESVSEVDFSDAEIEEQEFDDFSSKKKGKILKEFLDQEAELSGSDVGSEDELEGEGDDEFEAEGLTEEVLNEDKLRDEIGRVHLKTMLDADKKELRFFQEMYLEDGDLHTEVQGRERKFRWKSIDDSQDDDNAKASDEEENAEEEDENWRMKRYEREVWLQEQKVLQVSPSPKKKLALNVKLVNRTASEKSVANLITVKESNEKSTSKSFLFRDRSRLSHLVEKYNRAEDDRVGKRATKNFVFTTTSPVKTTIKPAMKRSLTDPVGANSIKKLKATPLRSNSVFNYF